MAYKIYSLDDPNTDEIRYIGYTATSLQKRYRKHIQTINTKSPTAHKNKWIRFLKQQDLQPKITLLFTVLQKQEAICIEVRLIAELRAIGYNLTNNTDGGDGGAGYKFSEEKKAQIRSKRIGKKIKPYTEARKLAVSIRNKGQQLTPEQKERMCAGIKRRFENPEERAKLSRINIGKKLSEETKYKMSLSRIGKAGLWNKGRKHTEATKQKMRLSHQKRLISNGF